MSIFWPHFQFPPINLWVMPQWDPKTEHDEFMIQLYNEHRDLQIMIEGWPEETAEIIRTNAFEEDAANEWYPYDPGV